MEKQTSSFISWAEFRDIDLARFLASIGHEPVKIIGQNYWYRSPLRDEKTPSFKVNTRLNRWYDFGLGKGGSIVDFCLEFYQTGLPEIVQLLSGNLSLPCSPSFSREVHPVQQALSVTGVHELSSPSLLSYLKTRAIPEELASPVLKEVRYQLNGKSYYGLGFKNDQGGYEIRNRYFKGSSSPKAVTTLANGQDSLSVFEGFFDWLSYQVLQVSMDWPKTDYLVLNSLSFVQGSLDRMLGYQTVHLFLDNDPAGQKATDFLMRQSSVFKDCSSYYKGLQDLNEFLTRKQPRLKVARKLKF